MNKCKINYLINNSINYSINYLINYLIGKRVGRKHFLARGLPPGLPGPWDLTPRAPRATRAAGPPRARKCCDELFLGFLTPLKFLLFLVFDPSQNVYFFGFRPLFSFIYFFVFDTFLSFVYFSGRLASYLCAFQAAKRKIQFF